MTEPSNYTFTSKTNEPNLETESDSLDSSDDSIANTTAETDLGTAFDQFGNENFDDLSSVDDDLVDLDLPLNSLEDSNWPDDSFDCD